MIFFMGVDGPERSCLKLTRGDQQRFSHRSLYVLVTAQSAICNEISPFSVMNYMNYCIESTVRSTHRVTVSNFVRESYPRIALTKYSLNLR